MADEDLEPNEWEVEPHDADHIKLVLRADSGRRLAAILPRSTIPELIARLVSEIGHGQGTPIAPSLLRPGLTIQVQGFGARRHQDGSADLTIMARLPEEGRDVTIPLPLSPADVDELVKMLTLGRTEK
jgi:hypothetical protein